jgi:hypothetical protein
MVEQNYRTLQKTLSNSRRQHMFSRGNLRCSTSSRAAFYDACIHGLMIESATTVDLLPLLQVVLSHLFVTDMCFGRYALAVYIPPRHCDYSLDVGVGLLCICPIRFSAFGCAAHTHSATLPPPSLSEHESTGLLHCFTSLTCPSRALHHTLAHVRAHFHIPKLVYIFIPARIPHKKRAATKCEMDA